MIIGTIGKMFVLERYLEFLEHGFVIDFITQNYRQFIAIIAIGNNTECFENQKKCLSRK